MIIFYRHFRRKKESFHEKKISIIIAVIVIIALIAAAAIFHYLSTRTHFNEGYVNGNTAGNLYNGGLFCEYDGTVYFSNPSDGGKLYSMSPDGSNLVKLCDDTVSYINADEHYLYYVRNNPGATGAALSFLSVNTDSLCRIDREGGDDSVLILDSAPCLSLPSTGIIFTISAMMNPRVPHFIR